MIGRSTDRIFHFEEVNQFDLWPANHFDFVVVVVEEEEEERILKSTFAPTRSAASSALAKPTRKKVARKMKIFLFFKIQTKRARMLQYTHRNPEVGNIKK